MNYSTFLRLSSIKLKFSLAPSCIHLYVSPCAFGDAYSPWICSIVGITSAIPQKGRAGEALDFDNMLGIFVSTDGGVKWLWEPTGKHQNGYPFLKLGSQFAKLSGDIDVAFAFTKVARIVHNDIERQARGLLIPAMAVRIRISGKFVS
jgi:hypothetical protein